MPRRQGRGDLAVALARVREELRRSRRENRNVRRESRVLREAAEALIHHAPAREGFVFIRARRDRFGVESPCRVLVTGGADCRVWVRGCGKGAAAGTAGGD